MNIVGKILVILVFLMSLATGGFLAIDYATRTNWKAAYETLRKEMEVAQLHVKTSGGTTFNLNQEVKRVRAEIEELKQKLIDREQAAKAMEEKYKLDVEDAIMKAKDADLNTQKALAEKERMKTEIKDLHDTIKKREVFILDLEKDNHKFRIEAVANENIAKAMQARNENLLSENQRLTRDLARLQSGVTVAGDGPSAKDPNALNPPLVYVKGSIMKIHADDRSLVEVSVGSDHGVNKNHTLEVYRLQPRPEYLGTIRILDARHHNSVGRLMRPAGAGSRQLQEGDIVASTISANK